MNFLILGDGAEERTWARAIAEDEANRIVGTHPGFDDLPGVPRIADFDEAMALAEVEAVVVGGSLDIRGEWLRRVAAAGLPAICLHPPGDDAEAYYQVALSREETGAVVVPDLPARLHPAFSRLKRAIDSQELGPFRGLRIEWPAGQGEGDQDRDLARHVFPRIVDAVRALIGEIEALTATGDPPGIHPTTSLIVQLRGHEGRRAEVRIEPGHGPDTLARLMVTGAEGSLSLEFTPHFDGPARLVRLIKTQQDEDLGLPAPEAWGPHEAILSALTESIARRDQNVHPNLLDGTRAMELSEATVRSLKRGRTVDLHYEEISEAGAFKGVMTSIGCVLLLCVLFALPIALVGPALGFPGTIYLAYAIPPVLIVFILLQTLRFAIRNPGKEG